MNFKTTFPTSHDMIDIYMYDMYGWLTDGSRMAPSGSSIDSIHPSSNPYHHHSIRRQKHKTNVRNISNCAPIPIRVTSLSLSLSPLGFGVGGPGSGSGSGRGLVVFASALRPPIPRWSGCRSYHYHYLYILYILDEFLPTHRVLVSITISFSICDSNSGIGLHSFVLER